MTDNRPTVFIVDDDEVIRLSCNAVLQQVGLPTELFASASEFLGRYESSRAGCLLLDIRMPDMSGLDLQKQLIYRGATIPIIFITGVAEVPVAVEALRLGAFHYLQKPIRMESLLDWVRRALAVDATTRANMLERRQAEERFARLTERERKVLEYVVGGLSNKEAAARLHLSTRTVEIHRAGLMKKLGARNTAHLVRMAIEVGLSTDSPSPGGEPAASED